MMTTRLESEFYDKASQIASRVEYRDWNIEILNKRGMNFLRVSFMEDGELQKGRKWYLSPYMTTSEIVLTIWKAIFTCEEHEARERFRYKGARIFGPHVDVEKKDNLDLREAVID